MPEPRICPICDRPNRRLYETVDGEACSACMRYSGTARVDPAPWRINLTRGVPDREWPGRPGRVKGAGGAKRRQHGANDG
jgi:hypothetical protein